MPDISFHARPRIARTLIGAVGLIVLGLGTGCAHFSRGSDPQGLLGTDDLTTHCQRLWSSDRESFHLCQQLQNRNRSSLTRFANARGIDGQNLESKARHGDATAKNITRCIDRWQPDYTSVWRCVQDNADEDRNS